MSPASNNQLGITVVARDEATKTLGGIHNALQSLDKGLTSMSGRISFGVFNELGRQLTHLVETGVKDLLEAIPNLLQRGSQWADVVEQITLETGMSAQQASQLAAVQQYLTGSTDGLTRGFIQFGKSLVERRQELQGLGVDVSHGVYPAFTSFLDKIKEMGPGAASLDLSVKMLGRGFISLAQLVQLPKEQFDQLMQKALQSGQVMTDAQVQAAKAWRIAQNEIGGDITGIGSQLLGNLAPVLTSLASGVSNAIESNMGSIVDFATKVVAFVAGLISGLLGITLQIDAQAPVAAGTSQQLQDLLAKYTQLASQSNKTKTGVSGVSSAIKDQIAAIDAQLAAMGKADQRQQQRDELNQLRVQVQQARTNLADIQAQTVFAGGMSEEQYILAQQRQAAEEIAAKKQIADAEKQMAAARKRDAEQARRDHLEAERAALEKQIAASQSALSTMGKNTSAEMARVWRQIQALMAGGKGQKGIMSSLTDATKAMMQDAVAAGKQVATAIQTAIFGKPTIVDGGGLTVQVKQSGLLDKIGELMTWLGNVGNTIGDLNTWMSQTLHVDLIQVVAALVGLSVAMDVLNPLLGASGTLASLLGSGGPLELAIVAMPLTVGLAVAGALSEAFKKLFPNLGANGLPPMYNGNGTPIDTRPWWKILFGLDKPPTGTPQSYTGTPSGNATGNLALYTPPGSSLPSSTGGNNDLSSLFSQYLGTGSQSDQNAQDLANWFGNATDLLSAVQDNTQVLPDGTLLTTLPDGTKIKTNVTDWNAGQLPAAIQNWLSTQGVKVQNNTLGTTVDNTVAVTSGKFDNLAGIYGKTRDTASNTAWAGHGAATYLNTIDRNIYALAVKSNPGMAWKPTGASSTIGGGSAGAAPGGAAHSGAGSSAAHPLYISLSAPDIAKLARGGRVSTTTRPSTGY